MIAWQRTHISDVSMNSLDAMDTMDMCVRVCVCLCVRVRVCVRVCAALLPGSSRGSLSALNACSSLAGRVHRVAPRRPRPAAPVGPRGLRLRPRAAGRSEACRLARDHRPATIVRRHVRDFDLPRLHAIDNGLYRLRFCVWMAEFPDEA